MVRLFEPIEDEMELIQASAKFNYTINKTPQKEKEMILAYTDDTERLIQVLKNQSNYFKKSLDKKQASWDLSSGSGRFSV